MVFGPHSIRGWCFFEEKLSSSLQDPSFWYFQRLVRVKSASMTNKTPLEGLCVIIAIILDM